MRHRFALSILAILIALAPARSQDYPARPIRLLVTSPAGSLVDVLSRLLTQDLAARLGQSIIVDNRPGGMTQVAMDALVRAGADGYTLMPDVRMDTWFGVIAPANTPQPVVDRLVQAIDAVVHEPSFRDKLFALGCAVAWMPPAEFVAYITDETRKWSQLIPAMGISIEE
jgi:tripartite-type tricarboxylate transporter receptor subunit TctC